MPWLRSLARFFARHSRILRSDAGFGLLEMAISGALIGITLMAVTSQFSNSMREMRDIDVVQGPLWFEQVVSETTMRAAWHGFDSASGHVPPATMSCAASTCMSTYGGLIPQELIQFPGYWLGLPAGPQLTQQFGSPLPIPDTETKGLGYVASSMLADLNSPYKTPVDVHYCTATVTPERKSWIFQFKTVNQVMSTAAGTLASFHNFFDNTFTRTVITGVDPALDGSYDIKRLPPYYNTTDTYLIQGGQGWIDQNGRVKTVPSLLGFYWVGPGECHENMPPASVCQYNPSSPTPVFNFDFMVQETGSTSLWATRLTPANMPPAAQLDARAQAALNRCLTQQTLDIHRNFALQPRIYFCLYVRRQVGGTMTSRLNQQVEHAFGEFVFQVDDTNAGTPLTCVTYKRQVERGARNFYGRLDYTFYWMDSSARMGSPSRSRSGSVVRRTMPP